MEVEKILLKDTEKITWRINMNIQDIVEKTLMEVPQTRSNDLMLIAKVIKQLYGYTDTFDIALNLNGNVYESIRRSRAKIQETNPTLRPNDYVQRLRKEKEERIREEMKGL